MKICKSCSPSKLTNKVRRLVLLASCSVLGFVPELVIAQDVANEGQEKLNTDVVVVTANRREQNLQDVAASVVSVDPKEFKTQGLTDLGDLIAYMPGITLNNNGVSGVGSISARGVPQSSSIPVVGIYVDDVPFTSNSGYAAGSVYFYDGLLGDVERIEIVKGPQGTLYGANAVGGVVKYISRDPAMEEIRGEVGVDLSSTSRGGLNQIYNGRLSAPIVEDKMGITVAGYYEDRRGYVDVVEDGTGNLLNKDANTTQRFGFSVDFMAKLSERATFKFKGLQQQTDCL
ncbi:MAG: TonB-dependent receptor plug domain-containing protein [Emcibacteraceae bacterium]|nr:TonB-dependent receptor plug domain-containing protein [Emcibacteraceae bacterium]